MCIFIFLIEAIEEEEEMKDEESPPASPFQSEIDFFRSQILGKNKYLLFFY